MISRIHITVYVDDAVVQIQ